MRVAIGAVGRYKSVNEQNAPFLHSIDSDCRKKIKNKIFGAVINCGVHFYFIHFMALPQSPADEISALRAQLAAANATVAALTPDPTIARPPKRVHEVPADWTLCKAVMRLETSNPKLLIDLVFDRPTLLKGADADPSVCYRVLMACTRIGLFVPYAEPVVGAGMERRDIVPWGFGFLGNASINTIQASPAKFGDFARPFAVIHMTLKAIAAYYEWQHYEINNGI
jgi:hypothetical protein